VARGGSAGHAAQALHLSASAVSRSVLHAEQQLGVPLFERGARGMVPTPAAAPLLLRTARALAQLELGQQALPAFVTGAAARARAGSSALDKQLNEGMLHSLCAVAEARSESAAAQRLGVKQPAVHQQLRALEHAARVRLFERSHRGTRLTEAGECLLQHAKLALAELRNGHDEVAAFRGQALGRLAVGALPMASTVLLPAALSRLYAVQPGVVVTVSDGTYPALIHQLRHGDIDLMVGPLRGASSPPDLQEHKLFTDHLLAVVRAGHPALKRRLRGLGSVKAWPWISPLPGTPAAAVFHGLFAEAGLPEPQVLLRGHSAPVLVAVLQASDAIALLSPWQVRSELDAGRLVALPLKLSGTQRDIGCTLRRDGLPALAVQALQQQLQAVVVAAGRP
jgi:LysR family transcriptional regulator of gallate degradation